MNTCKKIKDLCFASDRIRQATYKKIILTSTTGWCHVNLSSSVITCQAVEHSTLCSGTRKMHIISRNWNIMVHITWYGRGLYTNRLIGPPFFDGPVNQHTYLDMLQNWFVPQLENLGIKDDAWFQHDGAPAHYALTVREYLSKAFWQGAALSNSRDTRSPNMSQCDNSPSGLLRETVALQCYQTTEALKHDNTKYELQ
jgi:hypothetical protein